MNRQTDTSYSYSLFAGEPIKPGDYVYIGDDGRAYAGCRMPVIVALYGGGKDDVIGVIVPGVLARGLQPVVELKE